MPVRIEKLTTEVQISTEDLPMTKHQLELVVAAVVDRLTQVGLERDAVKRMMEVPLRARPPVSFRE